MQNLKLAVRELMTTDLISVGPKTSMLEIDKIFKENSFHHLPVLNEKRNAVGILSKSNYNTLQHHFTFKKIGDYEQANRMYFRSLIAEDVMTIDPISIGEEEPIENIFEHFLKSKVSSILITESSGKCIGIVTPYDVLRWIKMKNLKRSSEFAR